MHSLLIRTTYPDLTELNNLPISSLKFCISECWDASIFNVLSMLASANNALFWHLLELQVIFSLRRKGSSIPVYAHAWLGRWSPHLNEQTYLQSFPPNHIQSFRIYLNSYWSMINQTFLSAQKDHLWGYLGRLQFFKPSTLLWPIY